MLPVSENTELQFTERRSYCGVKPLEHYLERNPLELLRKRGSILPSLTRRPTAILSQRNTAAWPSGGRNGDALRFDQLKVALKTIGFSKRHIAQTCQLLAAILHLGNLEFTIDRSRNEDAAVIRNTEVRAIFADLLDVQPSELLSYRSKLVKKEMCTIFLDPDGASDNRDELAKFLYSVFFTWLNEHINQRLCKEDFSTFIGLFDLPGPRT
ncbi:hypothetical protein K435DRAFT_860641 [Dendrothele bispora CBS 962.96]|uniref:Myosin motor domain-containing protein n=1 Tax=Dendrothele bispora (strain CBS 962.96) TaxID=1314807 RepID=A0A4S8LXH9_DENBC|nr:hypothetical protein K435DRAFT_860641 [Dendrothele bispora CBS 962.96]